MDWSEKNLCIKCNEGGNLLVCSENGCPLAIHEGCMGCPARFDDVGQFYCPYCLYKQAVAESRLAREYALARKKALLVFMDEEVIGGEKHLEENRAEVNGHNQPKVGAANVNTAIRDEIESRRNSDPILDQSIHLDDEDEVRTGEEEKVREEESENSAGSEGQEPSIEMHEDQKISNAEEKEIQEEEEETSSASGDQEPLLEIDEDQKISNAEERKIQEEEEEISSASSDQESSHAEEEKIQEEECETSSASTDQDPSLEVHEKDKRGSKTKKPIDRDSEAVLMRSKRVKKSDKNMQTPPTMTPARRSSRRSSSAMRNREELNENVDASRRSKQLQQPSVKLANHAFGSGKRKRLLWREEEEEMLKEGVRKYAEEGNKNHPWRKILEYGRKVFDETRTPGDLKDKWRNMMAK